MSDLISRQAVIDVLSDGKELLSRVLDDMDVVGTDREKYSWGLGLLESYIKDIEELPSAQPELIRCKNCKYNQLPSTSGNANCEIYYGMTNKNGFCHMAERRTDE